MLLRDRATNRYFVSGAEWSLDVRCALVLEPDDALALVERFSCEPEAVELVDPADAELAVA